MNQFITWGTYTRLFWYCHRRNITKDVFIAESERHAFAHK